MTQPHWWLTKDGDRTAYRFFRKHYSAKKNAKPKTKQFVGPGESIVLRTLDCSALFVWRKFIDGCIDERTCEPQAGINCAVFRNESGYLSSELVRQADAIADRGWTDRRHYTYVDPTELSRAKNPGWCFLCAGWRRCGRTKSGLLILERVLKP